MAWTHYDLRDLAPMAAYSLLTGVVVPRPIAWVTTRAPDGVVNAAPFSYFGLLGSQPPILAFGPGDRPDGTPKDTARHITPGAHFVVNLVPYALVDRMNLTATDFPPGASEPEVAGLDLEAGRHGPVPRLAASPVALECREHATLTIGHNRVVIGEVLGVTVRTDLLLDPARGTVNTPALELVGRMGGRGGYARAQDTFELPRVRYADWLAAQAGQEQAGDEG